MNEYVGFDVSKEATGVVLARGKAASDPFALFTMLKRHTLCPARIVLETGTLSSWPARALGDLGRQDARAAKMVRESAGTAQLSTDHLPMAAA